AGEKQRCVVPPAARPPALPDFHLHSVLDGVSGVGDYQLTGCQPCCDFDLGAKIIANRDIAEPYDSIRPDHGDARTGLTHIDGIAGNQDRLAALRHGEFHLRVHTRIEEVFRVVDTAYRQHRSRIGIQRIGDAADLAGEHAAREFLHVQFDWLPGMDVADVGLGHVDEDAHHV